MESFILTIKVIENKLRIRELIALISKVIRSAPDDSIKISPKNGLTGLQSAVLRYGAFIRFCVFDEDGLNASYRSIQPDRNHRPVGTQGFGRIGFPGPEIGGAP